MKHPTWKGSGPRELPGSIPKAAATPEPSGCTCGSTASLGWCSTLPCCLQARVPTSKFATVHAPTLTGRFTRAENRKRSPCVPWRWLQQAHTPRLSLLLWMLTGWGSRARHRDCFGKLKAGGESQLGHPFCSPRTSTAMLKSTMETLVLRCQHTCTIVLPR